MKFLFIIATLNMFLILLFADNGHYYPFKQNDELKINKSVEQ